MKIIVLAGGNSPEREVSLASGSLIANALIENGHEVMLLDLLLGVENKEIDSSYKNKNDELYSYKVGKEVLDLSKFDNLPLIHESVIPLLKECDVVFNALHGGIGENGKLQAVLDIYGIKYTGSDSFSSMLSMDKEISKILMKEKGYPTADYFMYDEKANSNVLEFPLVIKPCSCGSSVGVSIVNNNSEYENAIKKALVYEDRIVVEQYIKGREFSVGVLNDKVLPPIEIVPKQGFYDYENKYQSGATLEICPADLTKEENDEISRCAIGIHKALGLGYYSRIDFILGGDGKFYCLEANSLPGMTNTSLLPQEAAASGIGFNELVEMIVKEKMND